MNTSPGRDASPLQPLHHHQVQNQQEYYRVLRPELDTVAHDPLDPDKRYHEGVFVETDQANKAGTLFHVTGDVIAAGGMRYEERDDFVLGPATYLHRYTQLGCVLKADYHSGKISTILRTLPVPTKQQGINFWEKDPVTGRHEIIWTKENGERYGPGEQRRPILKCNEWMDLYAIPALCDAGLLRSIS